MAGIDYIDPESMFRAIDSGSTPDMRPIPEILNKNDVQWQSRPRIASIFQDWKLLRAIMERHEATIQKRWRKKTKVQRLKILLTAWPEMAASHRPDYFALRKETAEERRAGTKYRAYFLWPYINQEDLTDAKKLLLLFQARGRSSPDVFAIADEQAAHLGFTSGAIVQPFLNNYTMYFSGRSTAEVYGEIVAWDDDDAAFQDMMYQRALQPGAGLTLLEIQERIYDFLVECCKNILHDISGIALTSDAYPIQSEVSIAKDTAIGFDSLAVMAAEAPYRVPAEFDLARLQSLFAARVSAAEDHIWSMREDPSYYAEHLTEASEHRTERLRDSAGKAHPFFSVASNEPFWAYVISDVTGNAHVLLEVFQELYLQVIALGELHTKYAKDLRVDQDLPQEYLHALLRFRYYLDQAVKGPLRQLRNYALASPPMRPYFARSPAEGQPLKNQIVQKPGVKFDKSQHELLQLLMVLWENDYRVHLIGQTTAVDELERLLRSEPNARDMISSYVASIISNLSVLTEVTRQLSRFQPWAQTFEDTMVNHREAIEEDYNQRTKHWNGLLEVARGSSQSQLVRLGDPTERRFYYPIDKRRSKENVEAVRSAEQGLDAFWAEFDRALLTKMGENLPGTALWKLLSWPRTLQRMPEWTEPKKKLGTGQHVDAGGALAKPLSELYLDLQQRTEKTIDRSRPAQIASMKTKTKGTGNPPRTHEDPPSSAQPDPQPVFAVDARALKVFRTLLFFTPSAHATPGELAWTDFLYAMDSVGFHIEKLHGSAWQFQPTKLGIERGVQFHEPHPSGKLTYRVARRIGRRLERAYGWFSGSFVPGDKDGGKAQQ
ncbi:hypothetical protein LTR78_010888 [Recurvomyces mirabilis]|uniref:Uncharacterized protein n=1 Tax=Recurvomyces mirabilis TaxID=574656 RepID=A0AAE0WG09_9PEZI|nr:hypothetical protein LTR78_010888 [Recurvomyces mirabilis]KAK5150046.1 hypothetical protein LTS14_010411 [Recurvomyces mirabilis]